MKNKSLFSYKDERYIPFLGFVFMLISFLFDIGQIIYKITTIKIEIGHYIYVFSLILGILVCFLLIYISMKKNKVKMEKIVLLILSIFILLLSIKELNELEEDTLTFLDIKTFVNIFPYFLFLISSSFVLVSAFLLFINNKFSKIAAVASFVSRLCIVPLLAISIFEFVLSINLLFEGDISDSIMVLLISFFSLFSELAEHFFFDHVGNLATRIDENNENLTGKRSLSLVICVGIIYLSLVLFNFLNLELRIEFLPNIFIAIGFIYLFFVVFAYFIKLARVLTYVFSLLTYIFEIVFFAVMIKNANLISTFELIVFSISFLVFIPISDYLFHKYISL